MPVLRWKRPAYRRWVLPYVRNERVAPMTRPLLTVTLLLVGLLACDPVPVPAQDTPVDMEVLLWSVGEAETGDYPESERDCKVSKVGAVGRYQVMPQTAQWIYDTHGWVGPLDLCHEGTNEELARVWLGYCQRRLARIHGATVERISWCYMTGTIKKPPFSYYVNRVVAEYRARMQSKLER